MSEIEKLDLRSMDLVEDKKNQLKQLFPEVFKEDKIDFEKLKLTLGENVEVGKERFGMTWPGKADCFKIIQQPSIGTLKPCPEESVNFDTTENLFIEGDNLEILKLLQKTYYGKIKMIYIDPPYNTGNDFIYPDDYTENLTTYLQYTGQIDSEGKKFSTNTDTEGRFHTKWINMMYPRLYLARSLLTEDGLIFISINDVELNNLIGIMNEIFGEENFISTLIWKSRQNVDSRTLTGASVDHEYVVCYRRSEEGKVRGKEIDISKYSNPDNDPRRDWMSSPLDGVATKERRPNLHYTVINPETGNKYDPSPESGWRFQKSTMQRLIDEQRILWPKNPESKPRFKRYRYELINDFTGFSSVLDTVFTTQGTRELRSIMGMETLKFPKPVEMIQILIEQGTGIDKGDIVMDFFCGSATTGHAVMSMNKKDIGNRKFICVQLPESMEEGSDSHKAGLDTIAEVGKERLRRVIKIFEKEKNLLESKLNKSDLGFKLFKLDKSNFKIWNGEDIARDKELLEKQLEFHINHIDPIASQEDILFEILLKAGFELTTMIEKMELGGKTVYSISDGAMLVCLEKQLTNEVIKEMAEKSPSRVICLDQGFQNNDQLKTNAVQIMKSKGVEAFRTV